MSIILGPTMPCIVKKINIKLDIWQTPELDTRKILTRGAILLAYPFNRIELIRITSFKMNQFNASAM